MNKKVLALSLVTLGVVATGGVLFSSQVSAQENTIKDTFVTKLATRLGISEEKVNAAVDQTRLEIRDQHRAEMETKIDAAIASGELTDREVQIIEAKEDIRDEKIAEGTNEPRAMHGEMVEELNAKGLDVTSEELEALRDKMVELGVGGMGKGEGRRMMRMNSSN